MANPIYFVGGGKGGVGKSVVAMALTDFLQLRGESVVLVETDTGNPDVGLAYKDSARCERVNLDLRDGWLTLTSLCAEVPAENPIVINSAARNMEALARFGSVLGRSLNELGRELVTLWVINRQRDSIQQLRTFMEALPEAKTHVLMNEHFGPEEKFELYKKKSETTRNLVADRGGKSLLFPEVADRVVDDLFTGRLSIAKGMQEFPIGHRAELHRWRDDVAQVLAQVTLLAEAGRG